MAEPILPRRQNPDDPRLYQWLSQGSPEGGTLNYRSFLVKMYSILKIRLCAGMSQLDQHAASLVAYLIYAFKDTHCTFTHVSMPW